jgi:hypothetical protein
MTDRIPRVVLSRRNILALLSKLDRVRDGETSACEIRKGPDPEMPVELRQNVPLVRVLALPDAVAYAHREPGELLAVDVDNHPRSRSRLTAGELRALAADVASYPGDDEERAGDIAAALLELADWRESA